MFLHFDLARRILTLHLIAFIAIGACVVSLPICNADAYSPFADDVSEDDVLFVELRPGIELPIELQTDEEPHGEHQSVDATQSEPQASIERFSSDQVCAVCSSPPNEQPHQSGLRADTVAERFAMLEPNAHPMIDGRGDVPRSLVETPSSFIPPPNPPPPRA